MEVEENENIKIFMLIYAISNVLLAYAGFISFISWPIPGFTDKVVFQPFLYLSIVFYVDWTINLIFFVKIKSKLVRWKSTTRWFVIPFLAASFLSRFWISGYVTGKIEDTTFLVAPLFISLTSVLFALILYNISKEPISVRIKKLLQIDIIFLSIGSLVIFPIFLTFLDPLVIQSIILAVLLFKGISILFTSFVFFVWSRKLLEVIDTDLLDISWPYRN